MSFTQNTFAPVGAHSSPSPSIYTYRTDDTRSQVLSVGYFLDKILEIDTSDMLFADCSDGPIQGRFVVVESNNIITILELNIIGNIIFVSRLEDFILFDDTQVFLSPALAYLITSNVDIGDRVFTALGDSVVMSGMSTRISMITSSTTGDLFSGDFSITSRFVRFNVASGTIYNMAGTDKNFFFDAVVMNGIPGSFVGGGVFIAEYLVSNTTLGAIAIDNSWRRVSIVNSAPLEASVANGDTFLDLGSSFATTERFVFERCIVDVDSGGTGINVQSLAGIGTERLEVLENTFVGDGNFVTGATVDDDESFFRSNIGLVDTIPIGVWTMAGNSTVTTIVTSGVPVLMAGITVESAIDQKFTHTASPNNLVYDGAKPRLFNITGTFTVETSANNQVVGVLAAINGTALPATLNRGTTSGSGGNRLESLSISAVLAMNSTDNIQLFIQNDTSTDNITVIDALYQVVALN